MSMFFNLRILSIFNNYLEKSEYNETAFCSYEEQDEFIYILITNFLDYMLDMTKIEHKMSSLNYESEKKIKILNLYLKFKLEKIRKEELYISHLSYGRFDEQAKDETYNFNFNLRDIYEILNIKYAGEKAKIQTYIKKLIKKSPTYTNITTEHIITAIKYEPDRIPEYSNLKLGIDKNFFEKFSDIKAINNIFRLSRNVKRWRDYEHQYINN